MTPERAELWRILVDRQRRVGSPEWRFMNGRMPNDDEVNQFLNRWREVQ